MFSCPPGSFIELKSLLFGMPFMDVLTVALICLACLREIRARQSSFAARNLKLVWALDRVVGTPSVLRTTA
jgi:hypothetical protein